MSLSIGKITHVSGQEIKAAEWLKTPVVGGRKSDYQRENSCLRQKVRQISHQLYTFVLKKGTIIEYKDEE